MRDVALVPQRHVFKCGLSIAPYHARQSANLFARHRVSLVRHGRRALLPGAEILFGFADFRALQRAYFERDLLEGCRDHGQSGDVVGVAVALNNLAGDWRGMQPEAAAELRLHFGADVDKGSDRTRDFSY